MNEVIVDAEKRKDTRRVAGEKAVLRILTLTEELIAKENLQEFLSFAAEKRAAVQNLQRTILESFGQYTATGEQLFNHLTMDLGERVFDGLNSVGQQKTCKAFSACSRKVPSEPRGSGEGKKEYEKQL